MEGIEEVSWKRRATSATSSNSSVIEYVNEVFTESELEMSKSVNVEVTENTISVENPLTGVQVDKKDIVVDKKADFSDNVLQDFPVRSGSFQEVIEKGFRNMYLSALVVLLFAICMGVTATYTATATEDMKKKHSSIHPSSDDVTWIGSLMAVGALIGGSAGGYFTNTLGRKGTLMFNTAPFVAGWLFIIYAPSTGWIFIGRILSGFCVGIVSVATPMYLIEISTPEVRGLLGASFQLFVVIGILIVASLGSFLTWRNLAVSGAIICLTAAFLMLPMPESPRWLMAQKRREEAKRAFRFLQVKGRNLLIFLSIAAILSASEVSSENFEEENFMPQESEGTLPSPHQLMIRRILDRMSLDDNLNSQRVASLKRAHMRYFEELFPGFVGVRGRKSEKAKTKEPFPGFLAVRGKKLSYQETVSNEKKNSHYISSFPLDKSIAKYFQKDSFLI
ncbi:facilitated trehalose transporter Tret1-like isoform X2 [Stegodyphus dumicola]|uniref:facilitated trehalose transporter Tret1-like isoform X2 n=1 Tax=Stegodyphus dumicola TaxID=202533 RepID=UPI0015B20439|nr:facilitated trehalose transporter Tret1-like isoform X2 [Stegodyphus dumicola]